MVTEKKASQTNNNFLVTQSNQLVEANYSANLTTLAHKVAKLIIGFVHPKEEQKELSVTIEITKLKQYLGWSQGTKWNRFYKDLKNISQRLNKEPIEIILDDDKVLVAYFLSSYTLDIKQGEVIFDVSPKLVPHLTQLKKNFTTYQLKYIPTLTSSYAIRMYELFYQYLRIGKRKFTLEDFRKKLGAPVKYKYNDLKKRVIIPAQTQLKELTNIAFIFSEIKEGRRISGLEFIIFSNTPSNNSKQIELNFLTDSIEENQQESPAFSENTIQALENLGINEQNIATYLSQGFDIIKDEKKRVTAMERCETPEKYYLEKLELTKQGAEKNNAIGFFIKALQEDWASTKTLKNMKIKEVAKKRRAVGKKLKNLELSIKTATAKRGVIKQPIIELLIADPLILQMVYNDIRKGWGAFQNRHYRDILHLPIIEQYHKSPVIESSVNLELMKRYPEKFTEVIELDAQIKKLQQEIKELHKQYPALKSSIV